jgi:ABC-type sugar transport system permease subunit
MGSAEQAAIANVRFVDGVPVGDTIKVTILNTGATAVNIKEGYANENKATNIKPGQAFVIPKATSQELTLTFPNSTLVYGTYETVKLISAKGNTFVYSLTYDSTCTSAYNPLLDEISSTPRPLQASELNPPLKLSSFQAMVLFSTLVVASMAVVGACSLANYVLRPKNRKDLFVLLFFVTIIVAFTIIAVVFPILFPPQLAL